jgi:hypothetical protein
MQRMLAWEGTDGWRAEFVELDLRADGVRARGVQLGDEPRPYRADYRLDALDGFRTRRLEVRVVEEGIGRSLVLERGPKGWSWRRTENGRAEARSPAGAGDSLNEAEDCDLALSPLTNLMPIRRGGLASGSPALDLVCAWVSVPELTVRPYPQRYEHVRRDGEVGAVVRFLDRGPGEGFVADLTLDEDGLVVDYPGLARRRRRAMR